MDEAETQTPVVPAAPTVELQIEVNAPPEFLAPKYCNLIHGSFSQDRGELILDFVFFDERRKKDPGTILGQLVAKVAITKETAVRLRALLNQFLQEK